MNRSVSAFFTVCSLTLALCVVVSVGTVQAEPAPGVVKNVTIRTPRDIGYFAGDFVIVDVILTLAHDAEIEPASLPHPGPVTYWLDLRTIDVDARSEADVRLVSLKMVYQNFYNALDARQMEIPAFTIRIRLEGGAGAITADIPAWTIGVSPLREVAPAPKEDPRDYMRPDRAAFSVQVERLWLETAVGIAATLLALIYLAFDRAWWPFHARPARAFGGAVYLLRKLRPKRDTDEGYLEALFILHRGIDQTDHRRVMADDVSAFLQRHAIFRPLEDCLKEFFAASRQAFFASNTARSRQEFPFDAIEAFARKMAEAERARP
ncbi:nonribosomal peptide synthetase MxaA [Bradyrhizobium sp. SK17]|uniref:nonribosomal peptide synthetase MxaA n=1 Tax=Bradyrhizobium sp. SK17 TaxID=2057741 RepID=UPI000C307B06|nr:nonribosomal peptide synthetase MxaA [Bradyrhizobium sp. SK17]AUC95611.1 nonribosomal peptide synthetase MxaA [Bradyrhizobium sp. SK17]